MGSAFTGLALVAAVLTGVLWGIARASHHRPASGRAPGRSGHPASGRAGGGAAAPGHLGRGSAAGGHRLDVARLRAALAGHPAGSGRPVRSGPTGAGRRPSRPVRLRSRLVFLRRTPRAFVLDGVLIDITDGDGRGSPTVTDDAGATHFGPRSDDPDRQRPSAVSDDQAGDDAATTVAGRAALGLPFTIALRLPDTPWLATRVEKALAEWSEGGDLVSIDLTERKGLPRATVASRGWAVHLDLAGTSGLPVASR